MLLLPKPWRHVPIEMEHMLRLDLYKKPASETLRIFAPKPSWGYQVVTMADFTRLELFKLCS